MLTLRSLLLVLVLCPFLLAATPDNSPAREARQRGEFMAMTGSESSSWGSEHRRERHVSKKRAEHGRDDDDEHDHPGDDDGPDEHEDHDDDDDRARPPKAKLKVKNLTRDRQALNWIRLDARKSKGRGRRIVEYQFAVTLEQSGEKVHAPGASESPVAHVLLSPGRYVAHVKVKDSLGVARVRARRIRIRGNPIEDFDVRRVEWGLGKRWRVGDPSTTIAIPRGPLDYLALAKIFSEELTGTGVERGAVKASSGGCGSTMGHASSGLKIASGLFSFIPVAGPVLGITGEFVGMSGSEAASACTQAAIDTINNQLAYQEIQIQNIEKYMALGAGDFYNDVQELASGQLFTDINIYDFDLGLIAGCDYSNGGVDQFMYDAGLWPDGCETQSSDFPGDVASLAGVRSIFKKLDTTSAGIDLANLWDVTSTQVTDGCTSNCYQHVIADPNSDLLGLYNSLWLYLTVTYLPPAERNLVSVYDSYNNSVVSYYQRSLNALQAGFMMEWYVNQYNFYAAGCGEHEETCTSTQTGVCAGTGLNVAPGDYQIAIETCFYGAGPIDTMGYVPGTHYPPSTATDISTPETAKDAYNEAMQQLALVYAARVNQLYLNTLNWIVSDAPIPPQAYPDPPAVQGPPPPIFGLAHWPQEIGFSDEVGKSLPTRTPLLQVTAKTGVGESWTSDLVLYQFSIQDLYKCTSTLKQYNKEAEAAGVVGTLEQAFSDAGACPPIFSLVDGSPLNGGFYDGHTLQPYSYSVSPGGSDACPDTCSTCSEGNFEYACAGDGTTCEPADSTACSNAPGTCLASQTGALDLMYDIPDTWDMPAENAGNGNWAESCDFTTAIFSGVPNSLGTPPQLCAICYPYFGSKSCKICPSAQWTNTGGQLTCAEGTQKCRGFCAGDDNSCGDAGYAVANSPSLSKDPSTLNCAAPYGAVVGDPVCCGQTGTLGAPASACPADYPTCIGFIQDVQYGTCHAGTETFTDCTQCGGEPVLGLSAAMVGNVGVCANDASATDPTLCAPSESSVCTCSGNVYYGKKFEDALAPPVGSSSAPGEGSIATFSQMVGDSEHWVEAVSGTITCSNEAFGVDPAPDFYKQCYCEPGGKMAWYRPPVSYSGNDANLRGGLPYLSCANWKVPDTLSTSTCSDTTCTPPTGSANTPISSNGNYQADQIMLGKHCDNYYVAPDGSLRGAWVTTGWSCLSNAAESNDAPVLVAGAGGSCGTFGFDAIKNLDSTSSNKYAAITLTRPNAATDLTAGGLQLPMDIVFQCSEYCPGPGGESQTDHNKCINVVALTDTTISGDGYQCLETSSSKNALICTLIDGQEFSVNLVAEDVCNSELRIGSCQGALEVGQANVGCPSACSECASGLNGVTPGGQALVNGTCTGFCSGWGYCGDSDYNVANGSKPPIDCRQCIY